jgi:hypothetical protein
MSPGESQTVLIPKTISKNGVYKASDDNADGYSAVTVNVQRDNTNFVIREKNAILQFNKNFLGDAYTVWNDDYFTQKRLKHLQNGELLYGEGTDWKISNGALQPVAVDYFRGLTFTRPITLTNETTFKLRYSYSSRNQWSKSHFSFWENADPSSVLPTQMGIGDLITSTDYTWIVDENSPSSLAETTVIKDVTALQGKTVWILIYAQQITPLITGIWFE